MGFLRGFGLPEMLILLLIVLLLFGATRLPALGASLGKGIRAFRKGVGAEEPEKTATRTAKKTTRSSTKA